MPNENDSNFDNGGQSPGLIGGTIGFLTPWYQLSSLQMMSKFHTEGLRIPWTPVKLWEPHERVSNLANIFDSKQYMRGTRWSGLRVGQHARQATRAMYADKLGAFRAAGKIATSAEKLAMKTASKQMAKGMAARFLVSKAGVYGMAAVGAYDALSLGAMAVGIPLKILSDMTRKYKGLELGGSFGDSQGAMTSRQRSLQAITASQLQARSAIGNEAMLFHR